MQNDLIGGIIQREGGYVWHSSDRGGPTKYGITQDTLSRYLGRRATVEEVKNLTVETAREIYRKKYVVEPGFDHIDHPALQDLVVDAGVHHGPHRATVWLQACAGTTPDGVWGPKTEAAVRSANDLTLYLKFIARRIRLFGRIVGGDRSQAVFIEGWLNRGTSFLDHIADKKEIRDGLDRQ